MPDVNLDSLLSNAAQKIENFQSNLNSTPPEDRGKALVDVIQAITEASTAVSKQITQKKTIGIRSTTAKAICDAIRKMQEDPSTINKVNAVQIALFGTETPLLKMFEDMVDLMHTVESLKDFRGKKTASASESPNT